MSRRAYRVFLPLFLLFYGAAGLLTHSRLGGLDVYPLFAWNLYADAARRETQYTARLLAIDGRPLAAPLDLVEDAAFHRSADYWNDACVLGRFAAALETGDAEEARGLRRLFEANVLREDRVRYEVLKRTYDPLRRRATGEYDEVLLGTFDKDGGAGAP